MKVNGKWYPKTLGRAARYLRRNHRRFTMASASNEKGLYHRQLICQIKLDLARERGVRHPYNSDTGQWENSL